MITVVPAGHLTMPQIAMIGAAVGGPVNGRVPPEPLDPPDPKPSEPPASVEPEP